MWLFLNMLHFPLSWQHWSYVTNYRLSHIFIQNNDIILHVRRFPIMKIDQRFKFVLLKLITPWRVFVGKRWFLSVVETFFLAPYIFSSDTYSIPGQNSSCLRCYYNIILSIGILIKKIYIFFIHESKFDGKCNPNDCEVVRQSFKHIYIIHIVKPHELKRRSHQPTNWINLLVTPHRIPHHTSRVSIWSSVCIGTNNVENTFPLRGVFT